MVRAEEPNPPEMSVAGRPIQIAGDGYVSSDTCRACHPSEYASWRASYHRTMTQVATPEAVVANFSHVLVTDVPGNPIQLERRGSEFWATLDDPDSPPGAGGRPSRVERQIVMTTGSHQQQAYWYRTGHSRVLGQLPAMFLIGEQRWIPRPAAFMRPPADGVFSETGRWNGVCINCHATHGKWMFDAGIPSNLSDAQSAETTTAEFGIACEACHGPAREHVRANQSPVRRYVRHLSGAADPSIVQPQHLLPARTSEVCGQCHGVWNYYQRDDERRVNSRRFSVQARRRAAKNQVGAATRGRSRFAGSQRGARARPWTGARLVLVRRDDPRFRSRVQRPHRLALFHEGRAMNTRSRVPRVTRCTRADGDPRSVDVWADTHQVSPGLDGNEGCLQCHEKLRSNLSAHTKHGARLHRKQLLQLPHAVHDIWVAAGTAQPSNQLTDRSRER